MSPRSIDRLYHLTPESNYRSIERNGLLSTSRLLDQAGLAGTDRDQIERAQRRGPKPLSTGVVLRDQSPMPPGALSGCLTDGMQPADWYALINSMVFFWLDLSRLRRQARVSRSPQLVIEIDVQRFLAQYESRALVTRINTGYALRRPARRGRASFVPLAEWRRNGWSYEARGLGLARVPSASRAAELGIPDAVPDFMDYVVGKPTVLDGAREERG